MQGLTAARDISRDIEMEAPLAGCHDSFAADWGLSDSARLLANSQPDSVELPSLRQRSEVEGLEAAQARCKHLLLRTFDLPRGSRFGMVSILLVAAFFASATLSLKYHASMESREHPHDAVQVKAVVGSAVDGNPSSNDSSAVQDLSGDLQAAREDPSVPVLGVDSAVQTSAPPSAPPADATASEGQQDSQYEYGQSTTPSPEPGPGLVIPLSGKEIPLPSFNLHLPGNLGNLPFFQHGTTTPVPGDAPANFTAQLPRDQWRSNSMFCWALMLPWSSEQVLLDMQFQNRISLFACEEAAIYSNQEITIASQRPGTLGVKVNPVKVDLRAKKGGEFGTALNTDIFVAVWRQLDTDGYYRRHAWTVKVDPDAVFLPDRLVLILQVHPEQPRGVYLNNCKFGMHGPLEVFSRNAVQTWIGGIPTCMAHFNQACAGPCPWGEDMFIDQCLSKVLQVQRDYVRPDGHLLLEEHCAPPAGWNTCQNGDTVAFHPFKSAENYQACLAAAQVAR